MSQLQPSWWLRDTAAINPPPLLALDPDQKEPSLDPSQSLNPAAPPTDQVPEQTEPKPTAARFWSWGNAIPEPSPEPEPIKTEPDPGWWPRVWNSDAPEGATSRWWPFSASAENEEDESDSDASGELFRVAKLAVESAKDQCHYAVRSRFSTTDVELAVTGTVTEKLPVRYNHRKRPLTASEAMERALASEQDHGASGATTPAVDANFRRITLATKLRLRGEAVIHGKHTLERHLYRCSGRSVRDKKRRRIRSVVVIAVHSFMPSKLVKLLVGQNTGTAVQMAQQALEAVARWAGPDCVIDSVALDGQGTIASRTEASLTLLTNWAAEIAACDFVYVVGNSAAAPLAASVLCGMYTHPGLETVAHKKVGFLSLAGAMHGPWMERDAAVVIRAYTPAENDVINELFELQKPRAAASVRLAAHMHQLCMRNVKITMAASLGDQLVALPLALANNVRHPNIYRCVFADTHADVPVFMTKLVALILTMENVGRSDLNLMAELGDQLQGPKASVGSHGRILRADSVYDTGVQFALETTSLVYHLKPEMVRAVAMAGESNLFDMPWNMRGLINELLQVRHIENLQLLRDLVAEIRAWEPTTSKWREIKSCFAALEELTVDDILL